MSVYIRRTKDRLVKIPAGRLFFHDGKPHVVCKHDPELIPMDRDEGLMLCCELRTGILRQYDPSLMVATHDIMTEKS